MLGQHIQSAENVHPLQYRASQHRTNKTRPFFPLSSPHPGHFSLFFEATIKQTDRHRDTDSRDRDLDCVKDRDSGRNRRKFGAIDLDRGLETMADKRASNGSHLNLFISSFRNASADIYSTRDASGHDRACVRLADIWLPRVAGAGLTPNPLALNPLTVSQSISPPQRETLR
ncbi:hypothetical protein D9619_007701 [Psilocybe cf. subviscida]|uniref:Uncharacterized protein n=1 Tax=Psilocybe cf. subviscida TaxID=2480587 RepID=A0A8H5AU60_9AGAR|nr:hypothetical protein D9619_007701 [Psilocybe cf. subviscida]